MENTGKINNATKLAWRENWKDISVSTIMTVFDYPRVKEMLSIYKSFITRNDKIIEAGCGLGPWVLKLSGEGYNMTGVDYDPGSIEKIKSFDSSQKVYLADIRKMPFENKTFSVYLSFGVLEHFAEGPADALKEAHRILDDGARVIITVPYRNFFIKLKSPIEYLKNNDILRRIFRKNKKLLYYQRYFRVKEICDFIENAGFKLEKVLPIDHIFSLVSFSGLFRNKNSYDGENLLAVYTANILKRFLPWGSADSTLIVARKEDKK